MRHITLVDATDIASWANRRDAQALLPQLLRRLVHATVDRIISVDFPSGEAVQLGGWDGVVGVEAGNAFVPDGLSGWELGTNREVKGKADGDYEKRSQDPLGLDIHQSTFIFVTPRRWGGKEEWVATRQAEGKWREVRAYTADDLEQWLETAPAVHLWLSGLLGKRPDDAIDIDTFWADWSAATQPPTPLDLVLAGRGNLVDRIHEWLRTPSMPPLTLQAESRAEALAVFAAAMQKLPPDAHDTYASRTIVVRTPAAWNLLTGHDAPLILIQSFDSPDAIGRAARTGHRAMIPLGRADSASANCLSIPRLAKDDVAKALIAAGVPEPRAQDLAALARRSPMSFRRRIAVSPEVQEPTWARPAEARSLLPPLLAGSWNDSNEGDRQALAVLARMPYEQITNNLVGWSYEADRPVRRIGNTWLLIDREDAWALLSRYLAADDLQRLEKVALDVLGVPDPRFDLPTDQQWMAGMLGKTPKCSGMLYRGLADSLAMLGALGGGVQVHGGGTASDYAARIIRQILERANADWRIWSSLSSVLALLAEAAPDVFLDAVDAGLRGDRPVLGQLFLDQQQDPMFTSSPHTGLLWALESIAWSPDHLGRVAITLAKLVKIDPGGRLLNRPKSSLRQVFLLWHPQTAATLERRLQVLDMLRKREPDVAWQLLCDLLPRNHDAADYSPTPRWRDWVSDRQNRVTHAEYAKAAQEIAARVVSDVGVDGARWQAVIAALANMPLVQYDAAVNRLADLDLALLTPSARTLIWNALRELISRHRSFADAAWALPSDRVDRLAEVRQRFEPQDLNDKYAWLFGQRPLLPEGREDDWEAEQKLLGDARSEAARHVFAQSGLSGLLDLANHVTQAGTLGTIVADSDLVTGQDEDDLLSRCLAVSSSAEAGFAYAFAAKRTRVRGREWAEAKLNGPGKTWSPDQMAQMLCCMPVDERTWDLAEGLGNEVDQRYWHLIGTHWVEPPQAERAVKKLLLHGKPYKAVTLLGMHEAPRQVVSAKIIVEVLKGVLMTSPQSDPPDSSFSYHVSVLLDTLAAATEIEEAETAQLELAFLPVFGARERAPQILHRELTRNPQFFAQIIAKMFRAEGEEPGEVPAEDRTLIAERGHQLLQSWRVLPGTRTDGTLDVHMLMQWVHEARESMKASGRGSVGDHMIGQLLSGSQPDPDGVWPHAGIRDLIEEIGSEDLEHGIEIGRYNSRGTVSKNLTEGGIQEQQIADRYAAFAAAAADRWPRTAAMLRRISDTYRREARQEDDTAELREDLGHC